MWAARRTGSERAARIPPPSPSTGYRQARECLSCLIQPGASRYKLLLLAAEGVSNTEIAERLGIARPTVIA